MAHRFLVGFRGELTADDQRKLQNAGFGVDPESIRASAAYWVGAGPADPPPKLRHVVVLDADDRDDAIGKVERVLGDVPQDVPNG